MKEHGDERGLIFWGLRYGVCGGSYDIEARNASLSYKTQIALGNRTYFVTEEAARNVDFLASNHYNFLTGENLLGDDGGQSTKEVPLAINNDGCRRKGGHCRDLRVLKIQIFWHDMVELQQTNLLRYNLDS